MEKIVTNKTLLLLAILIIVIQGIMIILEVTGKAFLNFSAHIYTVNGFTLISWGVLTAILLITLIVLYSRKE